MTKITAVEPGSIAEEGGIVPGDCLLSVNGRPVDDILEFRFLTADLEFELEILKADGTTEVLSIYNEYGEDVGITFDQPLMSKAKHCANKCVFCFIDQMPKGMRESLYFKDDDSRLSFLQGNYITMTNLSDREIRQMAEMRLSPINVSVQATDPALRSFLLGNPKGGKLLEQMKLFKEHGIVMNCQIVLCPGLNDGAQLDRTLSDLETLFPQVFSVSMVPVGMTRFRQGLYPLKPYDKGLAAALIGQVEAWQNRFLNKYRKRMIYLADEFYLLAQMPFPSYETYEDFPQLENGVGMLAVTQDEFLSQLEEETHFRPKRVTVATGKISEDFIRSLTGKISGVDCQVVGVRNDFFGPSITVSGLVTGGDLIDQLKGRDLGEAVLIPDNMLRSGTQVFLDDVTVEQVQDALAVPVWVTADGYDFVHKLAQ